MYANLYDDTCLMLKTPAYYNMHKSSIIWCEVHGAPAARVCRGLRRQLYTYVYIYIYIHMHIYIYIHTYTYTHIHIYTYTHIHIYTYTHIHIHTHLVLWIRLVSIVKRDSRGASAAWVRRGLGCQHSNSNSNGNSDSFNNRTNDTTNAITCELNNPSTNDSIAAWVGHGLRCQNSHSRGSILITHQKSQNNEITLEHATEHPLDKSSKNTRWIYICIHTSISIYVYVYICMYTYIRIYIYTYIDIYSGVRSFAPRQATDDPQHRMCVRLCICMCMYV